MLREHAVARLENPEYASFRADPEVATKAKPAVANVFQVEDPASLDVDPDGLEAEVVATLEGVSFGGRLDRRTGGAVPRITDYKTGAKPQPAYLEEKLLQLYLYAAAEETAGRPAAEVELLYLGGDGSRVRRPVFPEVIASAGSSLAAMRAGSQEALADLTFEAHSSPLCRFCAFKPTCPQFARSVPPPGSDESNLVLAGRGLQRRQRPRPEPLEALVDTAADEG